MDRNLVLCVLWLASALPSFGQNPTLTITGSNLTSDVSTTLNTFSSSCLISLAPYIKLQALSNFTSSAIPLSKVNIFVNTIGGTSASTLGTSTEQALSTTQSTLFTTGITVSLGNSDVVLRYRILQAEMINFGWSAGTYSASINFTTPGSTLCLGSQSFPRTLTVTVDPYLASTTPANISISVNDFSYFRSGGISASHSFTVTHTSPYNIGLKSGAAALTYTPVSPNTVADPAVALVSAHSSATVALSTIRQNVLTASRTPVAGNRASENIGFDITSANLKTWFQGAGTYVVPLTYTLYDTRSATPLAADVNFTPSFTVNVSDMEELIVANSQVDLSFLSAAHYVSGVSVDMPAHLRVSKTLPYDVYVKASSTMLNGSTSTIPAGVLKIGPATGQTGVSEITLSDSYQRIISAAAPVTDRSIALKYSIPSANVSQLLTKPAGTYATTVTYSFISL